MAYSVKTTLHFTGLSIADDRFRAFETIRDANDPLMEDRRAPAKPLENQDYFGTLPPETHQLLHQKRLHAMIEYKQRQMAADQITAEQERQRAAKFSF